MPLFANRYQTNKSFLNIKNKVFCKSVDSKKMAYGFDDEDSYDEEEEYGNPDDEDKADDI